MARSRRVQRWSHEAPPPGVGFLREQERIRERRRVRQALHALDFARLYSPARPRWAAWS